MELQTPFDYKETYKRYKHEVLDPLVAQYVLDHPDLNLREIARRFNLTLAPVGEITKKHGAARRAGRKAR